MLKKFFWVIILVIFSFSACMADSISVGSGNKTTHVRIETRKWGTLIKTGKYPYFRYRWTPPAPKRERVQSTPAVSHDNTIDYWHPATADDIKKYDIKVGQLWDCYTPEGVFLATMVAVGGKPSNLEGKIDVGFKFLVINPSFDRNFGGKLMIPKKMEDQIYLQKK